MADAHCKDGGGMKDPIFCGFCPTKAKYDGNGEVVSGADYHVLENNTMQATLICFEMLFFAVAHRRVFSWRDFVLEGQDAKPIARALADMIDTEDVRGAAAWLVKSRVKETLNDADRLVDGTIGTVRNGVDGVVGFGRGIGSGVVGIGEGVVGIGRGIGEGVVGIGGRVVDSMRVPLGGGGGGGGGESRPPRSTPSSVPPGSPL